MSTHTDRAGGGAWTPRTSRSGIELAGYRKVDEALKRFGGARMRRWFDGTLTGDKLGMRVIRDLRQGFELARRAFPIDDEKMVRHRRRKMERSTELPLGGGALAPRDEVVADLDKKWARTGSA